MGPRKYMSAIVFSWLLVAVLWCNGCWEQENIALSQLKQFFDDHHNPLNWNENGDQITSDCCKWQRVKCSSATGRVIELYLNRSWGYDPPKLYLNASYFIPFEELRILNLRRNHIGGCLEEEGFEVLSSKLSNLEVLDLGYNRFDDSIVSSLTGISSLKSIYLDSNQMEASSNYSVLMTGFERLSRLRNLEVLDLTGNKFNNSLLSSLGSLSSLKALNVSDNQLSGTIDTQVLNNLSNLKELYMADNEIEGFAPSKDTEPLLRLYDLEFLNLGGNLFNNTVLSSLVELSRLKGLYLYRNRLTGSVHYKELEALTNLEELHMESNNIEEFVGPEDKTTLNNLQSLGLASPYLASPPFNKILVLQSLRGFSSLKRLELRDCILNRTLNLSELASLSTMEDLILDGSTLPKDFLQSIGPLTSLRSLSLHHCGLKGTLPGRGWCELQNLQTLVLTGNELEGTLPPCLANLSSLQYLDLSNNRFTGNIASTSISRLVSLEYLLLEDNQFQIPISFKPFANCSNLKGFLGDNNELTIDPTSQSWTPKFQLQLFSLSDCVLHQSIAKLPNFLYYQYDLRFVALSNSSFGGVVPSWLIENNTRLGTFLARDNSFTGQFQLPSHPNQNLHSLDISNNRVQGQIPLELCQLYELRNLDLSENNFFGSIPSCLNQMQSLRHVRLSKNKLSGLMSLAFMNNINLTILDLGNNNFYGNIPNWIGTLSGLRVLLLQENDFHGEIPTALCQLNGLNILDLSSNSLSGLLTPCLGNLIGLSNKHYATTGDIMYTDYKGFFELRDLSPIGALFPTAQEAVEFTSKGNSLPYTGNILSMMYGIDLSCNNFTGEIPIEFGNMSDVRALNLSHNSLTGPIPATFSNLKQLESLDLSHNELNGRIPPQLTQLNFLGDFNVAYNNLSGPVPDRKAQFGTFDERNYEGNPYLCGPPLVNSCDETSPTSPTLSSFHSDDKDGSFMDIADFYVSFVVSYVIALTGIAIVLYINPYWRQGWFHIVEVSSTSCYYFSLTCCTSWPTSLI